MVEERDVHVERTEDCERRKISSAGRRAGQERRTAEEKDVEAQSGGMLNEPAKMEDETWKRRRSEESYQIPTCGREGVSER